MHNPRRIRFHHVRRIRQAQCRWQRYKQMHVIRHPPRAQEFRLLVVQYAADVRIQSILPFRANHRLPPHRAPNEMNQIGNVRHRKSPKNETRSKKGAKLRKPIAPTERWGESRRMDIKGQRPDTPNSIIPHIPQHSAGLSALNRIARSIYPDLSVGAITCRSFAPEPTHTFTTPAPTSDARSKHSDCQSTSGWACHKERSAARQAIGNTAAASNIHRIMKKTSFRARRPRSHSSASHRRTKSDKPSMASYISQFAPLGQSARKNLLSTKGDVYSSHAP
jgi:hypothetical protein